jgi:phosphoribosyl-ATP pyrophosphohydrolase
MSGPGEVLEKLMAIIQDRRDNPPAKSYTTSLFAGGVPRISAKIIEEANEVVEAAAEPAGIEQRKHLIYETGDLLYHLFVLLGHQGIGLEEVTDELARRFGVSGLDEKAARPPKPEKEH